MLRMKHPSLKRLAWAFGCAKKGSEEEAELRNALLDFIGATDHEVKEELREARDYWRRNYQAEASENAKIRHLLGVPADDPDDTLTLEAVRKALGRPTGGEEA